MCAKHNIPTAAYGRFTDVDAALSFVREQGAPIVVKTDGLAAGKGVIVATTLQEAEDAVRGMLVDKVRPPPTLTVWSACIEVPRRLAALVQRLSSRSFLTVRKRHFLRCWTVQQQLRWALRRTIRCAVCTNRRTSLSTAQQQAVGDGDTGPNTGGMGAYTPAPVVTPAMEQQIMEEIVLPTARGMAAEGCPFRGVLFAGLMIKDGRAKLLEHNVRFGDPECQGLMIRMDSDLLPALLAACQGNLQDVSVSWKDGTALTVVMAARGYPGSYAKGTVIRNTENVCMRHQYLLVVPNRWGFNR